MSLGGADNETIEVVNRYQQTMEAEMARLPGITTREALPEDKRHVFDAIAATRGSVRGPLALLLYSPQAAERVADLGTYLRFQSVLPPVDLELAILVAARECDCAYEWRAHAILARQAGVREEAIEAIGHRASLDQFTEDEARLVAYGRGLLGHHRVPASVFDAVLARYGEQGTVEITATLGYYSMMACTLNAFEVEAPGEPVLP